MSSLQHAMRSAMSAGPSHAPPSSDRGAARLSRRGLALLEVVVSVLLLGAVLAGVIPLVALAARSQADHRLRQLALCELENCLERLRLVPWPELTGEACEGLALSDAARARLRGARLNAGLQQEEDGARRVTLELRFADRTARPVPPVRLVAWFYNVGGGAP